MLACMYVKGKELCHSDHLQADFGNVPFLAMLARGLWQLSTKENSQVLLSSFESLTSFLQFVYNDHIVPQQFPNSQKL